MFHAGELIVELKVDFRGSERPYFLKVCGSLEFQTAVQCDYGAGCRCFVEDDAAALCFAADRVSFRKQRVVGIDVNVRFVEDCERKAEFGRRTVAFIAYARFYAAYF